MATQPIPLLDVRSSDAEYSLRTANDVLCLSTLIFSKIAFIEIIRSEVDLDVQLQSQLLFAKNKKKTMVTI